MQSLYRIRSILSAGLNRARYCELAGRIQIPRAVVSGPLDPESWDPSAVAIVRTDEGLPDPSDREYWSRAEFRLARAGYTVEPLSASILAIHHS